MKKAAFLLVELMVAFAIVVLFSTIIVRFQRQTWLLHRCSCRRTAALERKIRRWEAHNPPRGAL